MFLTVAPFDSSCRTAVSTAAGRSFLWIFFSTATTDPLRDIASRTETGTFMATV
jgi:hypothetical protein